MVILHGLGDSMEGFRWLPPALNLPWLNYLLVNAPDPYYTGFSWYDFAGDSSSGIARSREHLGKLLDHLRESGFPTEQTILSGFSQGCLMTLETGFRYNHKLAGMVGLSGYVVSPESIIAELTEAGRKQHVLVTHGTRDPLIPFFEVKEMMSKLIATGLDLTWKEFEKAHTSIAGEEELHVIRDFIKRCFPA
ncbi:MAG: serine esterase [Verrucomicrobiales bacterium]|nr:serine esterase [Verrucomicrobiales bacterium]